MYEPSRRFYDTSGFDGAELVYVDDFQPAISSGGGNGDGGDTGGGDTGGGDTTPTCTEGTFALETDRYGSETSWVLTDDAGATVASGSGYSSSQSYSESLCLEDGDYTLTINDSYGMGSAAATGRGATPSPATR